MQYNEILTQLDTNVPALRVHIMPTVCTHEMGTLPANISTIFTKGDKQILQDKEGVYHYKNFSFEIKDDFFICDDLKFRLPQRTEINTFQRVALSLGMAISLEDTNSKLDVQKTLFRELMYVFTMLALKDLSVISNSFSSRKCFAYGKNVFEAYKVAAAGAGKINSTQKNIRWLNEQDTLKLKSKLFDNSESKYQAGVYSMKYVPTDFAEKIFLRTFDLLKSVEFVNNNIKSEPLDFTVQLNLLAEIRIRDVMLLLSNCEGYNNGFVIRPKITDTQFSRVYSVFTGIGSKTRKLLGFNNYDIGAALQTICVQLVENASLYPLHQELMNDKKAFRAKIGNETGKEMQWVKTELSKADNLDSIPRKYNEYPVLKAYCAEAQLLRKEIIRNAEEEILSRAIRFAKIKWISVWSEEKKAYDYVEDGKKESSIFFFIWTQWERQIRESMMSCFNNPSACHQVHDAVYSRQVIDPRVIEKKVLEDTGFKVQITVD